MRWHRNLSNSSSLIILLLQALLIQCNEDNAPLGTSTLGGMDAVPAQVRTAHSRDVLETSSEVNCHRLSPEAIERLCVPGRLQSVLPDGNPMVVGGTAGSGRGGGRAAAEEKSMRAQESALRDLQLPFCTEFSLARLLTEPEINAVYSAQIANSYDGGDNEQNCKQALQRLLDTDYNASLNYAHFQRMLENYEWSPLETIGSQRHACVKCTTTYKLWVCAASLNCCHSHTLQFPSEPELISNPSSSFFRAAQPPDQLSRTSVVKYSNWTASCSALCYDVLQWCPYWLPAHEAELDSGTRSGGQKRVREDDTAPDSEWSFDCPKLKPDKPIAEKLLDLQNELPFCLKAELLSHLATSSIVSGSITTEASGNVPQSDERFDYYQVLDKTDAEGFKVQCAHVREQAQEL